MRITTTLLFLFCSLYVADAQSFFINPPQNELIYVMDGVWADPDSIMYDVPPSYPGGRIALYEFLSQEVAVTFPAEQEILTQGGGTLLAFKLDPLGRVSDPLIIQTSNPALEFEFLDAINRMPDWEPVEVDGVNEPVTVYLPLIYGVTFNQLVFDEGSNKAMVGRSKKTSWLKGVLIGGGVGILVTLFFFVN